MSMTKAISIKWDMRRLRAKLSRWSRRVDAEQLAAVREYGAEAAKLMVKCTPPGNSRVGVGKALRALKERIRQDFEGSGMEPFQNDNLVWRRRKDGTLFATFSWWDGKKIREGRPSPFRVFSGPVSKAKLNALGAGTRVEYAKNVGSFMAARPKQYRMRRSGRAVRLAWSGVRHVASMAAVRKEMKARQKRAGRLMAGWKAMARKAGTKLPAAVEKQSGKGSATIKRSRQHKAVLTAHNRGNYRGLQKIVDRQLPGLQKKLRSLAKKRAKNMRKALK